MSSQVCMKTDKSLEQLATEIREALSLPPFTRNTFAGEPYCQFEMLGMLVLIHLADEEDREPEVIDYPYRFDIQMSFGDSNLNTDALEYQIQPYYAQLLAFRLDIETACQERQKVGPHWQIRYRFYARNPKWNGSILYGEPGWEPAVRDNTFSAWRTMLPMV
jgi:hypothetical protein